MTRPRNCIEELKSGDPCWQELVEVIGEEGQAKAAFDPFFVRSNAILWRRNRVGGSWGFSCTWSGRSVRMTAGTRR